MKKRFPSLVPLCLALMLTALPALAADYGAMAGQWKIDPDKTLTVNERARQAHKALGPDERAAMIASWQKRTLTLDFTANVVREEIAGIGGQDLAITRVEPAGAGTEVRLHFDNAESALLTLMDADTLKFVMDPSSPMVLTRLKKRKQ